MHVLAAGLSWVDLLYRGYEKAIATAVLSGTEGVGLIDPGPSTSLAALEDGLDAQGIRLADVRWLLLTHIHLDHAGATGSLVRRYPDLQVYVHARGARHLHDPSRLLESARRLYGGRMAELWGDVLPVPEANLSVLQGGERLRVGGRELDVAYTPGHAKHHVSYFDAASGTAFVGDTAGVCIDGGWVLPPTPPPDIDLDAWDRSVERVLEWAPGTLFLTHFGAVDAPRAHLRSLQAHLHELADVARDLLAAPGDQASRCDALVRWLERTIAAHGSGPASYGTAAPLSLCWYGLERYWLTRETSS